MPSPRLSRSPFLNLFLFFATLGTTFWAGLTYGPGPETWTVGAVATRGLVYAGPLIAILLCHEMGHYLAARRNGVAVSLPYFLPVPAFEGMLNIGTFGALIRMRSKAPSRSAMLEIGAAGPLAGLAVAVPLLALGLSLSPVLPFAGGIVEGDSLLYLAVKRLVLGPIPEGHDVILHPIAWASWIGLLVTMLNLFPIGQLDGGHIVHALFPHRHAAISRVAHLACLGLFIAVGAWFAVGAWTRGAPGETVIAESISGFNWLVWAGVIWLLGRLGRGRGHPPAGPGPLGPGHRLVGLATLVIFVLIFMPVPIHIYE